MLALRLTINLLSRNCKLLVILLVAVQYSYAQDSIFFAVYEDVRIFRDVARVGDNYFVVGDTHTSADTDRDFVVARLDRNFNKVWAFRVGGLFFDVGLKCALTKDTSLLVTGATRSYNLSPSDQTLQFFVSKFDKTGNLKWFKTYNQEGITVSYVNGAYHIIEKENGNFIVEGITNTDANSGSSTDRLILEIDEDGEPVSTTRVDCQNAVNEGKGFTLISDGGSVVAGVRGFDSNSGVLENIDGEIIKLNSEGQVTWARSIGTSEDESLTKSSFPAAVAEIAGGYLMAVATQGGSIGGVDLLLAKFDDEGDTVWTKIYGTPNDDIINSNELINVSENAISFFLTSRSTGNTGQSSLLTVTIDTNGNIIEESQFSGADLLSVSGMDYRSLMQVAVGSTNLLSQNPNASIFNTTTLGSFCSNNTKGQFLEEDNETSLLVSEYSCFSGGSFEAKPHFPIINNAVLIKTAICDELIIKPVIAINDTIICPGEELEIAVDLESIQWFDDQNPGLLLSEDQSVFVRPESTVTYYAQASNGYEDSVQVQVRAISDELCIALEIYELMTPNGDGVQDYFFIKDINSFKDYEVSVFNLYGDEVMHIHNYENDWGGNNVPDGQYFYHILINDINKAFKGPLVIQR